MSARGALRRLRRTLLAHRIPRVTPEIVRTLPHDPEAFTQGLVCHAGTLLESTGRDGRSDLRELDLRTGAVVRRVPLPAGWGEGVAVHDDRIVQLTWRSGVAYVFRYPSLECTGRLRFDGEGWGLTRGLGGFVMSDGSHRLQLRDDAFSRTGTLTVRMNRVPLRRLNDLQSARGLIYANVWYDDRVFEIDPATGRVRRIILCASLVERAQPRASEHVLNGIAWDATTDTFYLTGKCWTTMFEVRIPEAANR